MIHLQGLRTLVAIVDSGGVRAAAERLARTPSAVSMALKQLEDSIGAPLFEGERKVRPTTLGQVTIEKARELLKHYDNTCASIVALAHNDVSRCNVASVTSIASTILPLAIFNVKQISRKFEVMLREIHSVNLCDAVADGIVDIAFGRMMPPRPDLDMIALFSEAYDLVCREDHPLCNYGGQVPWAEVAKFDFIKNESFGGIPSAELIELMERSKFHASSTTSTFALVQSNVGITILPRLCRTQAPSGLRFLPLSDENAFRRVVMITKKGKRPTPATARLIASVRDIIQERSSELAYTPTLE